MKVVVGITGGTGTILAHRLLENLSEAEVHLIISDSAKKVMKAETDLTPDDFYKLSNYHYVDDDISARVSSGGFIFDSFVIIPCSISSLAKISAGIADTLITRVASVAMKERRKMIVVPREMPLSTIALENMAKLSSQGVIVAPAMPGYYSKPKTVDDMVNFVVARVLDLIGVKNSLSKRWKGD